MDATVRTWLVTGCSSGLGRAIAEAALAAGDRVAVTARTLSDAEALAAPHGDRALALALDVTDPASVAAAAGAAEAWGPLDVVVNNAAYGLYGAVEEVSDAEMARLFETNVFGVARLARAVLPAMRARKRGMLVNVGSISGVVGGAGNGFYSATKFALEALSEALHAELAPLGIRVLLLEPSGIRTDFHGRSHRRAQARIADYEQTAGRRIENFLALDGRQAGDPRRIADTVLQLVRSDNPPFRLLMGAAAVDRLRHKLRGMLDQADAWEAVSRSTDFPD